MVAYDHDPWRPHVRKPARVPRSTAPAYCGAALSVAAHIAIIGFTTAATMHGKTASPTPPKPEFIVFHVARAPKPIEHRAAPTGARAVESRAIVPAPIHCRSPRIDGAAGASRTIDVSSTVAPEKHLDRLTDSGSPSGRPGGTSDLTSDPSPGDWRGSELLMHIVSSAKPRYPEHSAEPHRRARAGPIRRRYDRAASTCRAFGSCSRRTTVHSSGPVGTRSFRFRPAEVNGKRVAALAEMPFEFQVR
jgi:hypothetical protein